MASIGRQIAKVLKESAWGAMQKKLDEVVTHCQSLLAKIIKLEEELQKLLQQDRQFLAEAYGPAAAAEFDRRLVPLMKNRSRQAGPQFGKRSRTRRRAKSSQTLSFGKIRDEVRWAVEALGADSKEFTARDVLGCLKSRGLSVRADLVSVVLSCNRRGYIPGLTRVRQMPRRPNSRSLMNVYCWAPPV